MDGCTAKSGCATEERRQDCLRYKENAGLAISGLARGVVQEILDLQWAQRGLLFLAVIVELSGAVRDDRRCALREGRGESLRAVQQVVTEGSRNREAPRRGTV